MKGSVAAVVSLATIWAASWILFSPVMLPRARTSWPGPMFSWAWTVRFPEVKRCPSPSTGSIETRALRIRSPLLLTVP